jgi:hypothetical protein
MFEFRAGISELEDSEPLPEWTEDETLRLLEYVEVLDDWKMIAEKMKRPKYECMLQFAQVEFSEYQKYDKNDPDAVLKEIVGLSKNPVMALIHTISSAVHPGLGSEIAKVSLGQLIRLPEQQIMKKSVLWDVALKGLEAALKRANDLKTKEEETVSKYVDFLLASVERRIALKAEYLNSVVTGSHQNTKYTDALAQNLFDTRDDD